MPLESEANDAGVYFWLISSLLVYFCPLESEANDAGVYFRVLMSVYCR